MDPDRLARQIAFLQEIDKLKTVGRQTYLLDVSRKENDAEHAWHLSMLVLCLAEHGPEGMDVARAVEMALIHDLVEIDAGDAIVYDREARREKEQAERRCADRLYAILPGDQGERFRRLWDEYERRETPEARFVRAVDRLQPLMHNAMTRGKAWREHGVRAGQVREVNRIIADGGAALWDLAREWIDRAVARGDLPE